MTTTVKPRCSVDGCDDDKYCKGLCVMHYMRSRRTGTVGPAERQKGVYGQGSITEEGYRVLHIPGHPLARQQGKVLEHRVVLHAAIGDGAHPCHWCGRQLTWIGPPNSRICADHLDENRLNNVPENLVPACLDCNTKRAAA